MMKTAISIGLMTVLSGACVAALAQPSTPTPAPTQQTAPKVEPGAQVTPKAEPAREGVATTAAAASSKDNASQHVVIQTMDTNKDGLVSRQEYMSHYEGVFGKIKKDSAGMINLQDLANASTGVTAR